MEIKTAEFVTSVAENGVFPRRPLPQFALVGRSNVGKSTLINCLCRRKGLARTSAEPGKTRLINIYLINEQFHLVDLPGYGFAKVSRQEKAAWGRMIQGYLSESRELIHVFCLVDIRHEPTEDDLMMNRYLRETGMPFTVIATKSDKLGRNERNRCLMSIYRALSVQPWEVICFSGVDGTGRKELLGAIQTALSGDAEKEGTQK